MALGTACITARSGIGAEHFARDVDERGYDGLLRSGQGHHDAGGSVCADMSAPENRSARVCPCEDIIALAFVVRCNSHISERHGCLVAVVAARDRRG